MSLHAILEAIRASGDSQVRKIEAEVYTQCNEILAEARSQAEKVSDEACGKAVDPAFKERARSHQRGRLQALQIVGNVCEEFVDKVLDQVNQCLARVRKQENYPMILRQLVEEAIIELEGSMLVKASIYIEADPRDREVLRSILDDMGLDLAVSDVLNCWGGLIARSEDNRVVVINTLEARLERSRPYLRRYLAALFESEEADIVTTKIDDKHFVSIP